MNTGDQVQVTNANGTRFRFPERGKLAYLERKNPFAQYGGSLLDSQDQLAKLPCLIDTNAAYTLATQWLAAISIDVPALESKYKSLSLQQAYCSPPLTPEEAMRMPLGATNLPPGHKWVSLPIFDITWGGKADDSPPVWVQIFGATKELLRIRMEDTSFSRRPPLSFTNALELNTRPDPRLNRYGRDSRILPARVHNSTTSRALVVVERAICAAVSNFLALV